MRINIYKIYLVHDYLDALGCLLAQSHAHTAPCVDAFKLNRGLGTRRPMLAIRSLVASGFKLSSGAIVHSPLVLSPKFALSLERSPLASDSFLLAEIIDPPPDLVILNGANIPETTLQFFKHRGIPYEQVHAAATACSMFNLLAGDGRSVLAFFFPEADK